MIDQSQSEIQNLKSKIFWSGFVSGCLTGALVLLFIALVSVNLMRKYTDGMFKEASSCLSDYAAANARIAELQKPIVLFEDKAPADLPHFDLHGLADIRPGALFTTNQTDLRARWVVQAGRVPVDVWKDANTGYGFWDAQSQKITGPFPLGVK